MNYCCIRACRNYRIPHDKLDLFPLPASTEERALWIRAFDIDTTGIDESFRVCGAHFRKKYFLEGNPKLEKITQNNETTNLRACLQGQKTFLVLSPQGEAFPILAPSAEALKLALPGLNLLPQSAVNFKYSAGISSKLSALRPSSATAKDGDVTVQNVIFDKQPSIQTIQPNEQKVCSIVQVKSLNPSSSSTVVADSQLNIPEGYLKNVGVSSDVSANNSQKISENIALALECEEENLTSAQKNAQSREFSNSEASDLLQKLTRQYTASYEGNSNNFSNSISLISKSQNISESSSSSSSMTAVQLSIKELDHGPNASSSSLPFQISVVPMKLEESQKCVPDEVVPKKVYEEILPIELGRRKNSSENSELGSQLAKILLSKEIPVRSASSENNTNTSDKGTKKDIQATIKTETDVKSELSKVLSFEEGTSDSEKNESDKGINENQEEIKQEDLDHDSSFSKALLCKEVVNNEDSEMELEIISDVEAETEGETSPELIELVLSDDDEDKNEHAQSEAKSVPEKEILNELKSSEKVKEDTVQEVHQVDQGVENGLKSSNAKFSSCENEIPFNIINVEDDDVTFEQGSDGRAKFENSVEGKEIDSNDKQLSTKKKDLQRLVTEFSISFLQDVIPCIKSGNEAVTMESLLQVKTCDSGTYNEAEAESLRFRLREENFALGCVVWLAERGYIPKNISCTVCGEPCSLKRDKSVIDGWCYACDKCSKKFEVKRNRIWKSFSSYTLEELLLLTYHWACQSKLSEIRKDVNLSPEKIFLYYTALQNFCYDVVFRKLKMKAAVKKVEVFFVQFDLNYILGAYDRSNDMYYLEVVPEILKETDKYIEILEKWKVNKNIIVSRKKICYWLTKFYTYCSTFDLDDSPDHLSRYLQSSMKRLFGHLKHQNLHYRVLQGFLNDLQWRQRYGKYLELAFWNILQQLFQSKNFIDSVVTSLCSINEERIASEIYSEEFLERWGPFKVTRDMEEMVNFNYFGIQDSDDSSEVPGKLPLDEISKAVPVENKFVKFETTYQPLAGLNELVTTINRMLECKAEWNQRQNEMETEKLNMNLDQVNSNTAASLSSSNKLSTPAVSSPLMPMISSASTMVETFPKVLSSSSRSLLKASYSPLKLNSISCASNLKSTSTPSQTSSPASLSCVLPSASGVPLAVSQVPVPTTIAPGLSSSAPVSSAYVPLTVNPPIDPSLCKAVFPSATLCAAIGSKIAPISPVISTSNKNNTVPTAIQVLKQTNDVEILSSDIAQMPMNLLDFLIVDIDQAKKKVASTGEKLPPVIVDVISVNDEASDKVFARKHSIHLKSNATLPFSDIDKTYTAIEQPKVPASNSIFNLQKLIPVIPSGSRGVTPLVILSLKTQLYPARQQESSFLRVKLREEHFVAGYLQWLVRHQHLPPLSTCSFCYSKNFSVFREQKCFEGYIYRCEHKTCFNQEPVKRPRFFEKFMFLSMRELLLLTYHWACQSDVEEILRDVPIDLSKIIVYFRALQGLCRKILDKKGCLGGVRSPSKIEAAVVKLGKVFILGAYDRKNGHTRLEALSSDEACSSDKHVKLLRNWINSDNILITETRLIEPNHVYTVEVNRTITESNQPGNHILNVTKYLGSRLVRMFGSFKHHELQQDVIQGFLDELQWREMYGTFVEMAFWNIFNHMKFDNGLKPESVTIDVRNLPLEIPFESKLLRDRWGPLTTSDKGYLATKSRKFFSKKESTASDHEGSNHLEKRDKRLDLAIPKLPLILSKKYSSFRPASNVSLKVDVPTVAIRDLGTEVVGESAAGVDFSKVSLETAHSLMGVKIFFEENSSSTARYEQECTRLGLKLKTEGFLSGPVRWMVKKSLIKSESPCYVCKGPSRLKTNEKFTDGCSQICIDEKCRFENKFRRPFFLASFGFSLSNILAIIYHWAVQTDPRVIVSVIHLDIYKILCVRRRIQDICAAIVRQCSSKLGNLGEIVEVSFAEYKNFFILGAFERKTNHSYLGAFPNFSTLELGKLQVLLQSWITKYSTVVVPSKELYGALTKCFTNVALADRTISDRHHPGYHVLNIINYFHRNISFAFREIEDKVLTADLVQKYLYEFMWRERYGRSPEAAFWRIMKEICTDMRKDWPAATQRNYSKSQSNETSQVHALDPLVVEKCVQNNLGIKISQDSPTHSSTTEDSNEYYENDSTSGLQAYERFLSSRLAALHAEEKYSSLQCKEIKNTGKSGARTSSAQGHVSKKSKVLTDMQTTFILSEDVQELPYLPEARVVLKRIPEDIMNLHLSGIVSSASALEALLDKESNIKETPETTWEAYKASYLLKNLSKMAESNNQPAPSVNTLGNIKIQSVISQGVIHTDAIQTIKSPTKDALSNWWKDGLNNVSVTKKPSTVEPEIELKKNDHKSIKLVSVTSQKEDPLSVFSSSSAVGDSHLDDAKPGTSNAKFVVKMHADKQSSFQKLLSVENSSTLQDNDLNSGISIIESLPQSEMKLSATQRHVEEICLDSDLEESVLDTSVMESDFQHQPKKRFVEKNDPVYPSSSQDNDCTRGMSATKPGIQKGTIKQVLVGSPAVKPSKPKRKYNSKLGISLFAPAVQVQSKNVNSTGKNLHKSSSKSRLSGSKNSGRASVKRKFSVLENLEKMPIHTYSRAHIKKALIDKVSDEDSLQSVASEENEIATSSTSMNLHNTVFTENTKLKCLECDELVDSSHFLKQFWCSDCKRALFSTHCPKSFFEHRSRILFGKRMHHVRKQILWHKLSTASEDTWYCLCGFSTNIGNQIALHLIKCKTMTCYKPAEVT